MYKTAPLLASLAMVSLIVPALASPLPEGKVPLPVPRPQTLPLKQPVGLDSAATGSVARAAPATRLGAKLKSGLDALGANDLAKARAVRDTLSPGSLDRHILAWAIALSGAEGVPSGEIAASAAELSGWPGLGALRGHFERALYRENPAPVRVLAALGNTSPETIEGTIVLSRALLATGERARATSLIAGAWRTRTMDKKQESIFAGEFSSLLQQADHKRRMEMLLYRDRVSEAELPAERAGAQSLYRAWVAVIRSPETAERAIADVHRSWQADPAYLYIRIRHLRALEREKEAAALLAKMPKDKAQLVDPDEWWIEQRIVSRGLYERGDRQSAYRLAAAHSAVSPAEVAEAEFHAGWFALRGLKDGARASRHFAAILDIAKSDISRARAYYWLGRAAGAGEKGKAAGHFADAARYPATFYGQLANASLGRKSLNIGYPSPSEADRSRFAAREAVQAIRQLEASGLDGRANILYRALAGQIDSPGELAILAAMAEKKGAYQLSLQVGKIAWARGLDVAALAFPLGAVPAKADIKGSGKALAYSIARQESAFDKAAISPANAQGLLQLLPATARTVAARHGLPYSEARLTTDPGYNATLGAHYLGEQIGEFGGSYILTFIAYNAGPRRVPQWIERFGDPRGKPLDEVIDWIEMIPFTETRHYVQRIIENYQVYKARLGQSSDIENDLRFGRR